MGIRPARVLRTLRDEGRIPATVAASFEILFALQAGDLAGTRRLATRNGQKRIKEVLGATTDPRAEKIRTWDRAVQGRVQGDRALCRFGNLDEGLVVVLELGLERGAWRLHDILLLDRDSFEDFGSIDEGQANVLG